MKSRPFDKLREACKCCKNIIGLETDECKCSFADENFEWEMMDDPNVMCIRFEFGISKEVEVIEN